VSISGLSLGGLITGDDFTISSAGSFANKNVANGKTVTLSNTFGGTDLNNYAITDQTSTLANITPKSLTVSGIIAANKVYDGNRTATIDVNGLSMSGLVGGDDLTISTSGLFIDKNVGAGKSVSLTTSHGGLDVANYNITDQAFTQATITRLNSVTWIGGPTGDWSDPSNWAGAAIPDLANVANVLIPTGVTPTFSSNVSGPVSIDSLSGGNFRIDSGSLGIFQNATLDNYIQNGGTTDFGGNVSFVDFEQQSGTLGVGGRMNVTNSFVQSTNSTINVAGDVDINNTVGRLTVENLSGRLVNLNSANGGVSLGDIDVGGTLNVTAGTAGINQLLGRRLTVTGTSTFDTLGNITLSNSGNNFNGPVNATGNHVSLNDSSGGLMLGNISTVGTFTGTSTDGPIFQSSNSVIITRGATTFEARRGNSPTDILLIGGNNDFRGSVDLFGQNVTIIDKWNDLTLGTVIATGNFSADARGGTLTQAIAGLVSVAGVANLNARSNVSLLSKGNDFRGRVNSNAPRFNVNDIDGTFEAGFIVANEANAASQSLLSSAVYDTDSRHKLPTNVPSELFSKVTDWLSSWRPSDKPRGGAATVTQLMNENTSPAQGSSEIYIRANQPKEEELKDIR